MKQNKWDWRSFKDELPELGSFIMFGNHRWVNTCVFYPENQTIATGKLHYKDITHWYYIDKPPVVDWDSPWILKPRNSTPKSEEVYPTSLQGLDCS